MTPAPLHLLLATALLVAACGRGSSGPAPGEVRIDPTLKVPFRYAPPGEFFMGSPEDEAGRDGDEMIHTVELTRGFWVMESEVTQELWLDVMGSNPALLSACGPRCPVERVSWYDALAFANRLSARAGLEPCYQLAQCRGAAGSGCPQGEDWCHGDFVCDRVKFLGSRCPGYRLPTEAEWEYAARAGSDGPTWRGTFESLGLNNAPGLDQIAWYGGNSSVDYIPAWDCSGWKEKQFPSATCGTHPVGLKGANPWGLSDILGNVWEWVWEFYGPYPEGSVTDPFGASQGQDRIRRGCSWANIARHCRAADRTAERPTARDRNWGLRLARTELPNP